MNIDSLSIDELVTLRDGVSTRLQTLVEARQSELKAEADKLAGLTGQTILKPAKRVKYRKGNETWSGTGSKPAWAAALGDGLEQYRVREGA